MEYAATQEWEQATKARNKSVRIRIAILSTVGCGIVGGITIGAGVVTKMAGLMGQFLFQANIAMETGGWKRWAESPSAMHVALG